MESWWSRVKNLRFRAWDKFDEKMLEVHGINFDAQGIWTREMIDVESDGNFVFLDEVELLQSTGLKDKNGVEIFEGNIVRIKSSDGVDYKAVIIFKDGGFCAVDGIEDNYSTRRYQLHKGDFELEVIGNKYEHPHLLEE